AGDGGDVDEGDDDACDEIVDAAVGQDAHDVARAAVGCGELALGAGQHPQHLADVLVQLLDRNPGLDVRDRPADIGLDQVQQLRRGGREVHHPQVVVEEHRRNLGAFQEI